jgi:flagellar motor protein MotB
LRKSELNNTSNTLPETGHPWRDWLLFREYGNFCKKRYFIEKIRRLQMKKIIAMFIIVLAAFYTVTLTTACTTTLPPPPDQPAPPPPPPPSEADQTAQPPDMSPPEVSVELTPQPYSPISPDGEEQLLTIKINVKSASPIYAWHIELRDTESNELFLSMDQGGEVPEIITWDGRNLKGEMVESATVYNFSLTVANIYHNSMVDEKGFIIPDDKIGEVTGRLVNGATTYQGTLVIDVLVQREEKGLLRIIVPSIIFAPNIGELGKGLDPVIAANNDRILRRIAEVLNYFGTYKVKVEGHANPISRPNTKQRITEETRGLYRGDKGLKPLSEERARAVVNYLVKLGVDRSRLTPVGMGSSRIRAVFTDRANWWKNRRVEFILDKPETVETNEQRNEK